MSIELFSSLSSDFLQAVDEAQLPWAMWKEKTIPDVFFATLDAEFLYQPRRAQAPHEF